jgi:hypothetical protein
MRRKRLHFSSEETVRVVSIVKALQALFSERILFLRQCHAWQCLAKSELEALHGFA